ncbi:MAG: Multi-sensor signal transduction histidine kinase [Pedosphaera sp.]|nr:Multi-sensor signal transduction histidine kinase [Pedosphaera sp.]
MGFAVGSILSAFVLRYALSPWLGDRRPFAFFALAAMIVAWHGGVMAGVFALCLGLLLGHYFFALPAQSFNPTDGVDMTAIVTYGSAMLVGMAVIGHLHRTRQRVEVMQKDAERLQREMTERRRAEEALRQSEARYHELADAMPQMVWTAGAEGQIEYVNKKWFEYTGLTAEQTYANHGWLTAVHPDDREMVQDRLCKAVTAGEPFQIEERICNHGGEYRWHLCRGLPVKDGLGKLLRWFATSTDIEENKRTEQDLERAQEQLAHHAHDLERRVVERTAKLAESVRALEGVLYHVAHDLRAPLRAMEGFTQILLEGHSTAFSEVEKDSAWRIVSAANRMDQLIKDLLVYGHLMHMEVPCRKINLEAQMDRALVELEDEIKFRRAEIQVERPAPHVWANPVVLDQILTNLLSNAIKFVSPNTIPRIQIGVEEDGGKVRLWIRDNGIGIDETYQEQIFRVFERLEPGEGYLGTGIGLAIVRKGAERMGGSVGVESKPGKGSRFWVQLSAMP